MEKIYTTKRHIVFATGFAVATMFFVVVGLVLCYETLLRMRWPSVSGEIVSCVQNDILVQRHRSPGNRLYFEERTVETMDYCYAVNGRMYFGRHKDSMKAAATWRKGARRELISHGSHTPIEVWFCVSNPETNVIEKPTFFDAPIWPWILAVVSFLFFLAQLAERRENVRLNESLPKVLGKAQVDAFRRKMARSGHKVIRRRP